MTHRYHTTGTNTVTLTVVTTNGVFKSVQHDVTVIGLAIQWERWFGSNWQDMGNSFVEARDGGFIIAGAKDSSYVDQNHLWLFKTDRRGHVVWEKSYDGLFLGNEVAALRRRTRSEFTATTRAGRIVAARFPPSHPLPKRLSR